MADSIVYLVQGTAGEYDGRTQWTVCAYHDETLATQHAAMATEQATRMEAVISHGDTEPDDAAKLWDQNMILDSIYRNTVYSVVPVTVRATLPKPIG